MDADIDLNGLELFGEDMDDAEIDLDGSEIDLNDINMDGNHQDNHERTTTVPARKQPPHRSHQPLPGNEVGQN
ncbi:hypothetical protein L6452_06698 [Arctium lappa]|uniref:Uncharacterized protein n=1 Tax=Arctium lappa TaxID=4217 RepID=A0ACB9EKM7_ARCLA|nr:hypothetical protein L6452_06698 [Arctium lappa]